MANFHLSVKFVSRGQGRSSVGAAAYRAGEKLYNQYDGITHDFTRKGGVIYKEIILPHDAPVEYLDRQILWNAVEMAEKRVDARTAREIEVSLPRELSSAQHIELLREYANNTLISKGMCADIAIHAGQNNNPHAHILLPTRPIDRAGFLPKKDREWEKRSNVVIWRKQWADTQNKTFERLGLDVRVDHRSYADQGLDKEPTLHEGVKAREMEKRGIRTELGEINRQIKLKNDSVVDDKAKSIKEMLGIDPLLIPFFGDKLIAKNISQADIINSPEHDRIEEKTTDQHSLNKQLMVDKAPSITDPTPDQPVARPIPTRSTVGDRLDQPAGLEPSPEPQDHVHMSEKIPPTRVNLFDHREPQKPQHDDQQKVPEEPDLAAQKAAHTYSQEYPFSDRDPKAAISQPKNDEPLVQDPTLINLKYLPDNQFSVAREKVIRAEPLAEQEQKSKPDLVSRLPLGLYPAEARQLLGKIKDLRETADVLRDYNQKLALLSERLEHTGAFDRSRDVIADKIKQNEHSLHQAINTLKRQHAIAPEQITDRIDTLQQKADHLIKERAATYKPPPEPVKSPTKEREKEKGKEKAYYRTAPEQSETRSR